MNPTILVCDDDRAITNAIAIYLKNDNYNVLCAYNGHQALEILNRESVQLVILDIMMPGLDGLSALTRLRGELNIPVILLSAKTEDTDKILGLHLGADDYVTKPFNAPELLARVKSQLRRYTVLGGEREHTGVYRTGGLVIDDEAKTITVDGEDVRLTPVQYKILLLLMRNPGRVFSTDEIYERVWGEEAYNIDNTIAVHIRNIREKIEINPREPEYLKVVWGIGYKIEKLLPK